jgi:hypothetical protein
MALGGSPKDEIFVMGVPMGQHSLFNNICRSVLQGSLPIEVKIYWKCFCKFWWISNTSLIRIPFDSWKTIIISDSCL